MSTRVQIYTAENDQPSFRIYRGSNIILTPHEQYSTRENVRRALRTLSKIASGWTLEKTYFISELAEAIDRELKAEALRFARATNAKKLAADEARHNVAIVFPSPTGGWK